MFVEYISESEQFRALITSLQKCDVTGEQEACLQVPVCLGLLILVNVTATQYSVTEYIQPTELQSK